MQDIELKKQRFAHCDKEYLLVLIDDLQSRLDKKNKVVSQVRTKLSGARKQVNNLKNTIYHQQLKLRELRGL